MLSGLYIQPMILYLLYMPFIQSTLLVDAIAKVVSIGGLQLCTMSLNIVKAYSDSPHSLTMFDLFSVKMVVSFLWQLQ
jgi:hypothetical protein